MPSKSTTELQYWLERFQDLNPEISLQELDQLYTLAKGAPAETFSEIIPLAENIIRQYISATWKRTNAAVLEKYHTKLTHAARQVASAEPREDDNQQDEDTNEPGSSQNHSIALTHAGLRDPLTYCRVISSAEIPKALQKAVDACQERNHLLSSVVEYILRTLHCIDPEQAFNWELRFISEQEGALDPDVVRDMLRVWGDQSYLPSPALSWVLEWSHDNELQRQWPAITAEANAVLRQHILRNWLNGVHFRWSSLMHLRLLLNNQAPSKKLRNWLITAVASFGESIDYFVRFSQQELDNGHQDEDNQWANAASMQELQFIQTLFIPILTLSELLLAAPNGAYHVALALFGLTGRGWEQWHQKITHEAEEKVLGLFLRGLRQGSPPAEIIRELSFGDEQLYRAEMAEIDVGTGEFGSVAQRNKVVQDLAVYYTSYLESERLPGEITRRYRDLMRVVHEDNLRRELTDEQIKSVDWNILQEVSTLASAARNYLTRRRDLRSSLEEMTAIEMEFAQSVRDRRLYLLRRRLTQDTQEGDKT